MDNELMFEEGKPFYYQIGEVSTILPWWRPNYDRLCRFLSQEEVTEVLNKYADVEIIGNCLWDFDVTWDLDLRLVLAPYNPEINEPDWDQIEDDINKLNNLALNEWRILLDVGVTPFRHTLPSRKQVEEYIKSGYEKVPVEEHWILKIAYTRKVVGDQDFEYDIRKSSMMTEPMNSRYLTRYYPDYHKKKIVDKILNSTKEYLENTVSVETFLSMGEEEFTKFQNY